MSVYREITEEDLKYSGVHVWPKNMVDFAQDRYIHRRPELAYLVAKRRMIAERVKNNEDRDPAFIQIRILRAYKDGGKKRGDYTQKFSHQINYDDPEEDVREFLDRLRAQLKRCMPDTPLLNCSVVLRFYDLDHKTQQLLSWRARWL